MVQQTNNFTESQHVLIHFFSMFSLDPPSPPLKTSLNERFSDVFTGCQKRTLGRKGLIFNNFAVVNIKHKDSFNLLLKNLVFLGNQCPKYQVINNNQYQA